MRVMANEAHLKILRQGGQAWNAWRKDYTKGLIIPDLSGINLDEADLFEAIPIQLDPPLGAASIVERLNLTSTNFIRTSLCEANLTKADLRHALLYHANLQRAILEDVNFTGANLNGADFSHATVGRCTFGDNDLSAVKGLDTVPHTGPSVIGVDTLYRSGGKIPEAFLRGCGLPDEFISYLPSLIGAKQAVQFYSCFISYSSKDEQFANRLSSRMREAHLRVWFAPEDVKGGEKLRDQIDRAIQLHDRLLIVLSDSSLQSKWVENEIRRARKVEVEEKRRKLFPIRLVSYEELHEWECFDADTGEDLAREVREYFIPDFSNWKDHDLFEAAFDRLLKDLRAAEKKVES